MNTLIVLTGLIFCAFCSGGTRPGNDIPTPFWQQSETLNIQLGVRDRNGSLEYYDAVFLVQRKDDDTEYKKKLRVKTDEWGFAYFPDDFDVRVSDGEYIWNCTVDGRIVSYGDFIYSKDQRKITIPKKP